MLKNFLKLFFFKQICPTCTLCDKALFMDEKRVCHDCLINLCKLHIHDKIYSFSDDTWRFLNKIKDEKTKSCCFEALLILAFDQMEQESFFYFFEKRPLKVFESYFLAKKGDEKTPVIDQKIWVFLDKISLETMSIYQCSQAKAVSFFYLKNLKI
jgi:hypothetical protein